MGGAKPLGGWEGTEPSPPVGRGACKGDWLATNDRSAFLFVACGLKTPVRRPGRGTFDLEALKGLGRHLHESLRFFCFQISLELGSCKSLIYKDGIMLMLKNTDE